MAEINLFAARLSKLKKKQKLRQWGWQGMVTVALIFSCLLIVISGYSLVIARQNKALSNKIEAAKKEIVGLSSIESKQVYLLSKIQTFSQLLTTQEKHQAIAEVVFALLPDGTSLKGFQVSEEGLISLSGSVPDYPTLLALMARIEDSAELNLPVTAAKVQSIGFSGLGGLNFAIDVVIKLPS